MGGGYTIRVHSGSGHAVSGNRVVDGTWVYGPVSSSCAAIEWSDNRIVEIDENYAVTADVGELDCEE